MYLLDEIVSKLMGYLSIPISYGLCILPLVAKDSIANLYLKVTKLLIILL